MLNHFSLSRAWQRHSLSWSKCISHPICLHSRHTSQDQRLWSLSDEKSSQPYTSHVENKFQASKNKRTFCLSDLSLQIAKLWLTRPMLKNCLSLKATRRSTSATCNQATKAHDKILDQAIVTQASRTSGPSKYDSCDYSLCENFTSHQRARIESNSPNTRFKEHRLQSSVKTVQLWTIQQALGKTRFQASAHSQEKHTR